MTKIEHYAQRKEEGVNLITVVTETIALPVTLLGWKNTHKFFWAKALTRVTVTYLLELKFAKMVRGCVYKN